MKSSAATFIEWGAVILVALYVVPRLFASTAASNARLATQYSPAAALQAQEARAVNTAGLTANTALANWLSQLLRTQQQQQAGSGSPKAGSSGGMTPVSSGGGALAPRPPLKINPSPDLYSLPINAPGSSVYDLSGTAVGPAPDVYSADLYSAPVYDLSGTAVGPAPDLSGLDSGGSFGGWDLSGMVLPPDTPVDGGGVDMTAMQTVSDF